MILHFDLVLMCKLLFIQSRNFSVFSFGGMSLNYTVTYAFYWGFVFLELDSFFFCPFSAIKF